MSEIRAVNYYERAWNHESRKFDVLDAASAVFHTFGQETSEDGGQDTVAVIELSDGSVKTVHPTHIQFMDPYVVVTTEEDIVIDTDAAANVT